MQEKGDRRGQPLLALAALLALLILIPGGASALPSKADQKCINTVNKNAAKIVKAQAKVICDCIKDAAKGKVEAQLLGTIENCLTFDRLGKVRKAKNKLDDKIAKDCASYPEDPNGFAPVDLSDPNFIKARSMEKDLSLIHGIFGSDLDAVIVKEGDPNTPNAKSVSKCQQAVAKQAKKCQDTKLKQFLACKKDGMKGKTPPGQISSSEDLERLCLQSDPNDPTTGQGDPRGKIAKECDSKLQDKIQKKCFDKSVDLSVAFPGFDPNSGTLKDFVEVMVECEVCLYWNNIDGPDRNCDLFDDGVVNGSCGDTICGNGVLDPGEDCDDGNTMDGDGCSAACLFECAECFDTIGLQCTGQLCSASVPCLSFNVICSAELCPAACPCCPKCGDNSCDGDETVCNCDSDCIDGCGGSCLFFVPVCGDGTCDLCAGPGESHENCPQDCPLVCIDCPLP